jgi:hypothetical protein
MTDNQHLNDPLTAQAVVSNTYTFGDAAVPNSSQAG